MIASATPAVTFEPTRHVYTVDGQPVPSVTQVLKATGATDLSRVPFETLERKRVIGSAVHAATHYFDEGDLDEATLAGVARPYLQAWQRFRLDRGFVPALIETIVYSRVHHFIGTIDRVGRVMDGPTGRVLLDIKTGDPDAAAADLQTAGYEIALREQHPELCDEPIARWSVRLCDDGTYILRQYPKKGRPNTQDKNEFLALVRAVHVRQQRTGGATPCWLEIRPNPNWNRSPRWRSPNQSPRPMSPSPRRNP